MRSQCEELHGGTLIVRTYSRWLAVCRMAVDKAAGFLSTSGKCSARRSPVKQQVSDGRRRQVLPLSPADELTDPHVGRYQSQLRPQTDAELAGTTLTSHM